MRIHEVVIIINIHEPKGSNPTYMKSTLEEETDNATVIADLVPPLSIRDRWYPLFDKLITLIHTNRMKGENISIDA